VVCGLCIVSQISKLFNLLHLEREAYFSKYYVAQKQTNQPKKLFYKAISFSFHWMQFFIMKSILPGQTPDEEHSMRVYAMGKSSTLFFTLFHSFLHLQLVCANDAERAFIECRLT